MMHPRWLALSLCALVGCTTTTTAGPRLLSTELHVGGLDERTRFELDDSSSPPETKRRTSDEHVDTPAKERRRKMLYFLGLGAAGFGAVGVVGFGIGGRIVQAQVKNGYEDGTLTRDREDRLNTTGNVMNGLAIGSAVIGLAGVILSATMYGIDHARCGDLPPRRNDGCNDADAVDGTDTPLDEPESAPKTEPTPAPKTEPTPAPKTEPMPAPEAGPQPTPALGPAPVPAQSPATAGE